MGAPHSGHHSFLHGSSATISGPAVHMGLDSRRCRFVRSHQGMIDSLLSFAWYLNQWVKGGTPFPPSDHAYRGPPIALNFVLPVILH